MVFMVYLCWQVLMMTGRLRTSRQIGHKKRESTSSAMINSPWGVVCIYGYGRGHPANHAHYTAAAHAEEFGTWLPVHDLRMATFLLSQSERDYIVSGVREDLRADGRTCTDYRHFKVRTGVVSNTSGSAKIELVRKAE
jgi:hypothetical protein